MRSQRPGGARRDRRLRLGLPAVRRTVRLRLTALYAALFIVSGAILLAIAGGFAVRSSTQAVPARAVPAPPRLPPSSALANAHTRIRILRHELVAAQSGTGQLRAFSRHLVIASVIALGLMTLVSALMGWYMAGRALRPVRDMTAAARRISARNLDERLAVTGPADELKELGDTIDGLLERLESAFEAQRRFVANASHELRTPLATMRASLDVAMAKPGSEPPPQMIALAGRLRAELDRTDRLLEAFLVLARAQHRDLPGQVVVPVEYLVAAALADEAGEIAARHLTVRDDSGQAGAWLTGSQSLLGRMVANVIQNAVRHNVEGGWIAITAAVGAGRVRLVVENGGVVLDQEQVTGLSEPFRRIGADRIGSDRGSGLGLSIVAAITQAHDGTLDLRARADGGLRVTVELPAAGAGLPGAGR
ncbi:MAG: ATP-binding protein [Actinomycetota bacterium]|nr:ATP-binding protein [Actinomycetota bacterium]